MGRKIRTGALLILVLAMIYTQQAVIYAQNEAEKNMKKTTLTITALKMMTMNSDM